MTLKNPRHLAEIRAGLLLAGQQSDSSLGRRLDANETLLFGRALEHVRTKAVEALFPERKARLMVPMGESVDPGADTFVWPELTVAGRAKFVANYADDFPNVDAYVTENTSKIGSLGASYTYSIQDIRRAALAGFPLQPSKARWAREAIEREIDRVTAYGEPKYNVPGLLNNANVPLAVSGFVGDWPTADPDEILEDLYALEWLVYDQSSGVHSANRIVLPPSLYKIAATTIYSATTGKTVLATFLESSTFVKDVQQWIALETADAAGTGPRVLVYEVSPDNLELILPVEFETFPPQAQNMAFTTVCHARIGGVVITRPYALAYVDLLD